MANNKIGVEYTVNDKGSVDKLKKKTDAAAKSTGKLANEKQNYNRQEKGTAGITSNSTKAFSKMQQGIEGGLVPAYATLAANVFAVTAAFGVLQRAAATAQLEQGMMAVGRSAGNNLALVVDKLKDITDGALSTQNAMEGVAIATSAGFSESQITALGNVAKATSLALGRDMADAFTRVIRGTSKLEPELLDELGIFVKLGTATTEYAARMGKTAEQLTEFERRQAFVNAAIDEGTRKFGIVSQLVEANPYDRLAASFADLTKEGLNFLNTFLTPFVSLLADAPGILFGLFAAFSGGVIKQILPSIQSSALAAKNLAEQSAKQVSVSARKITQAYTESSKKVAKSFKTIPKSLEGMQKAYKKGQVSAKQLKKDIRALTQSEKLRSVALKNTSAENTAQKKREIAEIRILKAEMLKLQAIESRRGTSGESGTRAQNSSRSSKITSKYLTNIDNSTSAMGGFREALKGATLQFRTFTKLQGSGWTKITGFAKAAAGSVRLFGAALLSAIPVIGQLIAVGFMLYEGYKWLFESKPTLLEKELETAEKRYAEFPNIINQMSVAYAAAQSRAEAFATAMKPTVGLLKQTKEQIQAIINAEQSDKQVKVINARIALAKAEAALKPVKGKVKSVTSKKGAANAIIPLDRVEQAAVNKAQKQLEEAQAELGNFGTDTKEGIIRAVSQLNFSVTAGMNAALSNGMNSASSEAQMFEKIIQDTNTVINGLLAGTLSITAASEQVDTLSASYEKVQNSSDAAATTVEKLTNAVAKSRIATGAFATVITDMQGASNALGDTTTPEVVLKYVGAFERFGIALNDSIKNKPKDGVFTEEENENLRTATDLFNKHLDKIKQYNSAMKVQGLIQSGFQETARTQAQAGQEMAALRTGQLSLQVEKTNALTNLEIVLADGASLVEDKNAAILRLLKAQTAEKVQQEKIRKQEVADATRTMGGDVGAVTDTVSMLDRDKSKLTGFNPESIQTMNQAMQPMMDNLAKLGPEGELMSTVMQSAMNLGEVFSGAFEKISAGSFSMTDGLQAAASVVSALGSIQSAQGKAAVAAIDKQIEAEKKRDGKSRESMAKIQAMEKKKEQVERKNFEREKKTKMASAVISTALGMTRAFELGPILGPIMAGVIAAMGAAQISMISSQTFDGGGAGTVSAPSKVSVGNRNNTVDLAKSTSPSGELAYARGASGTGTGMTNYTPAFTGAKYRAAGGNTAFVVGEQGPEMFVPDRPGTIVPADDTASGMQPTINANINISAVDAEGVEDLLVKQRGNIIGMLREAANANGETFLESVSTMEV